MGREITAVADPDATLLLDVFAPGRREPLAARCGPRRRRNRVPAWRITDVVAADSDPDPIARKLKFDEHWYRLRRD